MAHVGMADICVALVCAAITYEVIAYRFMAYIAMAYIATAKKFVAHIVYGLPQPQCCASRPPLTTVTGPRS